MGSRGRQRGIPWSNTGGRSMGRMRNLQISELQKEIMLAEQDKEKSGDRWAKMTSMTDSKIAVSFLFNSATEAMATATTRAREVVVI